MPRKHHVWGSLLTDPDIPWTQTNPKQLQIGRGQPARKKLSKYFRPWSFYGRFIYNFSAIVSPITDLLHQDTEFIWGDAQETAFLKITVLFTCGKTLILRHYDSDRPALLETDASTFAIAGILSQKFEDGVRARMPAFGLVGIRMVFIGIRLQTWMRVIVDVDVSR
jgi:hypothetical protein